MEDKIHEGTMKGAINHDSVAPRPAPPAPKRTTAASHPIFELGQTVEVCGGLYRVHAIRKSQLVLKPIKN